MATKAKQLELFTNKFRLTEVGLEVEGKPDYEEWMDYGQSLKVLDGTARQFAIGDWIVMGFETYEHGKWDAIQQVWTEADLSTLKKYQWVSTHVKSFLRRNDLTFSHHEVVADLPPDKQRYWLEQAKINKWSVNQLRIEIESASGVKLYKGDMLAIVPNLGTFDLICTDPPYGVTDNDWDILDTRRWLGRVMRPKNI